MAGLIILAAVLRFWNLAAIPPGLYHDEAANGLDALAVLDGNRPIYFAANNGREPFFIYGVALSVALLGRSPGAIRIVAAVLGTLMVPAVYLMAREMGGRRLALLAATLSAVTVWPLALSRIGFRAISMPLAIALALWLLWRGRRTGRRWLFLLAGLSFGAASYTYLAARFTFIALLGFGIISYLFKLDFNFNDEGRAVAIRRTDALLFLLAAVLVLLPLLVYGVGHWDVFVRRAGQVSIFNSSINKGDFWGTLMRHTWRALGMFFVQGDFIPRHNVPLRPVFDPLMAVAFLLGLGRVLRERRRPDRALILVWLVVMILPTIIAEDSPHFLRAVGLQPVLFLVPALGLEMAWRWLEKFAPSAVAVGLVALVLLTSLGLAVRDYFRYGHDPELRYSFEAAATDMATEINRFLGTGWQGEGLVAKVGMPRSGYRVYLDERLWRSWTSTRFLVPEMPALQRLSGKSLPAGQGEGEESVLLVAWPYDETYRAWLNQLLPNREIRVREGSMERGDLEEIAYPLYVTIEAGPAEATTVLARLEGGLELVGYQVKTVDSRHLRVTLCWRATEPLSVDYVAFVQLLQDGQLALQSEDAPPGSRYLPTCWWRPGDVIVSEHELELREPYEGHKAGQQMIVGLYEQLSLKRLSVLNENGLPQGDYVLLNPSHD